MASIIYVESSADAAAKRERAVIEQKMDLWVKAVDALNVACREFSKYYVSKCDEDEVKLYQAKEKNISNLKKQEKIHRRALARQIALCGTRDEVNEMDFNNPVQIIDWLVRKPSSAIPSRASHWAWVRERNDVICCNPGPYDTSILHHAFMIIFIALWAVISRYVTILMAILMAIASIIPKDKHPTWTSKVYMKRENAGSWNSGLEKEQILEAYSTQLQKS